MNDLLAALGAIIVGALALGGMLARARRQGAAAERSRIDLESRQSAAETRERMRRADEAIGDDPAVLRDWLRARSGRE